MQAGTCLHNVVALTQLQRGRQKQPSVPYCSVQ